MSKLTSQIKESVFSVKDIYTSYLKVTIDSYPCGYITFASIRNIPNDNKNSMANTETLYSCFLTVFLTKFIDTYTIIVKNAISI